MELLQTLADFILHVDIHLGALIADFGIWVYLLLFAIIFCETGLVVTPFLPGDSLLFAAGAFAAVGSLDLGTLLAVLMPAAVMGDNTNYWIGRTIGPGIFRSEHHFLFRRSYLERTEAFYEKHGGKTVLFARFMPIFRTFVPFVAGIGRMHYPRFIRYSLVGTALWVNTFVLAGYFFGNIPYVRNRFTLVILAIIVLSFLPLLGRVLSAWLARRREARGATAGRK
jgi:membrane-associated protein